MSCTPECFRNAISDSLRPAIATSANQLPALDEGERSGFVEDYDLETLLAADDRQVVGAGRRVLAPRRWLKWRRGIPMSRR